MHYVSQLGPAAAAEAAAHLGVHAPWWAWALAAWALITILGLLRVDITGWVLGALLTAEITVIIAETISFAVVYAAASWAMAVHAGPGHVVAAATHEGPGLLVGLGGGLLSATAQDCRL